MADTERDFLRRSDTDPLPDAQRPDVQLRRERARLRALGWVLSGGLVVAGALAANSDSSASRLPIPAPEKTLEVDTKGGPVDCFGEQVIVVGDGDTVGGLVLEKTVRVTSATSLKTPDLLPIVGAVLESNGIEDPELLQPGGAVRVPDFCAYAPAR